ncbi:hypothetical protein ACHAPV_008175, partial [Trichoderma viride]
MATTATVGRTTALAFTEIDNLEPHTKRSGSIPLFHDTCPSSGRTIRADPQWPQIESPTAYGGKTEERPKVRAAWREVHSVPSSST